MSSWNIIEHEILGIKKGGSPIGSGIIQYDCGAADSYYTFSQNLDGGSSDTIYSLSDIIDGGSF